MKSNNANKQKIAYQTVRDVANFLQISEQQVRRWIRGGDLQAIKLGKEWRVSPAALDLFLTAKRGA